MVAWQRIRGYTKKEIRWESEKFDELASIRLAGLLSSGIFYAKLLLNGVLDAKHSKLC